MNSKKLIIIGKGNSANNIASIIGREKIYKFVDYNTSKKFFIKKNYNEYRFLISYVKNFLLRIEVYNFIKKKKLKLFTAFCKSSIISSTSKLGKGCFIESFVKIFNETKISENVMIESGSIIGSYNKIGVNTVVTQSCSLGSYVEIGKNCIVGMGSTITPGVKISNNCFISAREIVRKNIPPNSIFFQGKILKKNSMLYEYL